MAQSLLRSCLHCKELFCPNARNRWHQKFCSQPACRKASKAESQQRWLSKPENRDHFRGSANVERVRQWRKQNPGYWKGPPKASGTLQEVLNAQPTERQLIASTRSEAPLQDFVGAQDPLLVGLISQLIDSPLQEHIERTALRLVSKGLSILDMWSRSQTKGTTHENQKASAVPGASAASPGPLQLD